jgi:DNA (cytosine-5)-methyltransferase 1
MSRPVLLDLFAGAGGAAMGYYRAGFDVIGVDIAPQPHYPFRFIQADWEETLALIAPWVDAIHASPPCQHYSSAGKAAKATLGYTYPDLYALVRSRLLLTEATWVIENVEGAPAHHGVKLCGSMFGLPIQRHRTFESSQLMLLDRHCDHQPDAITVTGHSPQRWLRGARRTVSRQEYTKAMGIGWMTTAELVQAIPPVYTEWIGSQVLAHLEAAA